MVKILNLFIEKNLLEQSFVYIGQPSDEEPFEKGLV